MWTSVLIIYNINYEIFKFRIICFYMYSFLRNLTFFFFFQLEQVKFLFNNNRHPAARTDVFLVVTALVSSASVALSVFVFEPHDDCVC
jgi:hypothetical protein